MVSIGNRSDDKLLVSSYCYQIIYQNTFFLYQKLELFTCKLREILEDDTDCRGKYELVPLSGEQNELADVLVQILHHDTNTNLQFDKGKMYLWEVFGTGPNLAKTVKMLPDCCESFRYIQ